MKLKRFLPPEEDLFVQLKQDDNADSLGDVTNDAVDVIEFTENAAGIGE